MSKISKSAIDWKKLLDLVPPDQRSSFMVFKSKSEGYLRRVLANPPEPPKINWDEYKKTVPVPGLVDKLMSSYQSFKVPYPEDKYSAEVDKQWASLEPAIATYCSEMQTKIEESKKELTRIRALPAFDQMNMETFYSMCPDQAIDFVGKPSLWPHSPDEQMGYVDPTAKVEH